METADERGLESQDQVGSCDRLVAKDTANTIAPSLYVNDVFYERLVRLHRQFSELGDPPGKNVEEECERLIKREARLIDTGEFEQWLALFSRECLYWIPARRGGDPRREVALEFHDRRRLEDRIIRLKTGSAYSQIPPTRTCHLLSNIEMFVIGANEVGARANFVIHTSRLTVQRALAGWCGYVFAHEEVGWKIALKQVNLLDSDQGQENNSFFL
jgi:benzoate/toluate 1,2-dioxygenase beta subunit